MKMRANAMIYPIIFYLLCGGLQLQSRRGGEMENCKGKDCVKMKKESPKPKKAKAQPKKQEKFDLETLKIREENSLPASDMKMLFKEKIREKRHSEFNSLTKEKIRAKEEKVIHSKNESIGNED